MTPLSDHYRWVRAQTMALAEDLSEADCQVQSMPDASPVKWHLAHTTWFFETFVLEPHEPAFRPFDPAFRVLFNSYYQGVGQQHPRAQRGLVTRPDLAQVKAYRAQVDTRVVAMLQQIRQQPQQQAQATAVHTLVQLGLQHEQQHHEQPWRTTGAWPPPGSVFRRRMPPERSRRIRWHQQRTCDARVA